MSRSTLYTKWNIQCRELGTKTCHFYWDVVTEGFLGAVSVECDLVCLTCESASGFLVSDWKGVPHTGKRNTL